MRRLRHVLWVSILAMLLVFGAIADRALLDQGRLAEDAARAEADEKARLTAVSVRAALAQLEHGVLTGRSSQGITTLRLAKSFRSARSLHALSPALSQRARGLRFI
jgi:hypothetical protein